MRSIMRIVSASSTRRIFLRMSTFLFHKQLLLDSCEELKKGRFRTKRGALTRCRVVDAVSNNEGLQLHPPLWRCGESSQQFSPVLTILLLSESHAIHSPSRSGFAREALAFGAVVGFVPFKYSSRLV